MFDHDSGVIGGPDGSDEGDANTVARDCRGGGVLGISRKSHVLNSKALGVEVDVDTTAPAVNT